MPIFIDRGAPFIAYPFRTHPSCQLSDLLVLFCRAPNIVNRSCEPRGQELACAARISLDRTQMRIDDRLMNLAPGMAVTVEIKTG